MKSTGEPEPTRGARKHVRLWTARFPSWGPRRTDTAETGTGRGRPHSGRRRETLEAGCGTRPTPSATQTQQGSAVPPIRSPARATASQCWFLKGEAAVSARYAVRKVSPGATSLHCAACSFRSADVGCCRLFVSPLDISFTQVSLPLKCSLEFHFLSLLYPTFHDAHEG